MRKVLLALAFGVFFASSAYAQHWRGSGSYHGGGGWRGGGTIMVAAAGTGVIATGTVAADIGAAAFGIVAALGNSPLGFACSDR